MKTLIISSGFHPVLNNMGGAIEKLIETYLIANDNDYKNDITLYSVKENKSKEEINYLNKTELRIIDKTTMIYKIKQVLNTLVYKITKKYKGNVYINEVIKDLKRKKELDAYDCIIVENIGKFMPIIRKNTNSKLVLHLHNDYLNINTKDAQKIVKSSDSIWCVSEFIVNKVRDISEEDKDKVKLLYNGVDFENFKNDVSDKEKLFIREKYNIDSSKKIILYTGRLMPEKGVKQLLKAFKKISEERKDIVLLVAGGTREIYTNEDKFVKELKEIASGIKNQVIFTGKIKYENLYEVYSIADVQVVPSVWEEAFGLIVVEGMSYSIPLIVTNSGGIPEIVTNDVATIIDKEVNLEENIYNAISDFFNNIELMKKRTNKYSAILEKFTKDTYNNNFNTLMNKLLEME